MERACRSRRSQRRRSRPLQTQVGLDFFPGDGLFTSLGGFLSFLRSSYIYGIFGKFNQTFKVGGINDGGDATAAVGEVHGILLLARLINHLGEAASCFAQRDFTHTQK